MTFSKRKDSSYTLWPLINTLEEKEVEDPWTVTRRKEAEVSSCRCWTATMEFRSQYISGVQRLVGSKCKCFAYLMKCFPLELINRTDFPLNKPEWNECFQSYFLEKQHILHEHVCVLEQMLMIKHWRKIKNISAFLTAASSNTRSRKASLYPKARI